ncbi:hypothetical protein NL676_018389 [Syzygium grande]|nr:hypothetical protein NL676_018389 [Syzygium grande]
MLNASKETSMETDQKTDTEREESTPPERAWHKPMRFEPRNILEALSFLPEPLQKPRAPSSELQAPCPSSIASLPFSFLRRVLRRRRNP